MAVAIVRALDKHFRLGLTDEEVNAAVKTYLPSGTHDPYIMFASGGHAGQIFVIGIPSMRILKEVGVFTPEPWQGWGFGNEGTMETLAAGDVNGNPVRWADTHHPALSETNGDYDGQFVFINDKANSRVAVVDLRDFETKQIVKNPIAINDHGGTMVTPNSEYVIEGAGPGRNTGAVKQRVFTQRSADRRADLHTDAGGDDLEEAAAVLAHEPAQQAGPTRRELLAVGIVQDDDVEEEERLLVRQPDHEVVISIPRHQTASPRASNTARPG